MSISDQDQQNTDFDWFALDTDGFIGHFTTAGFKRLPDSVARSRENLQILTDYFHSDFSIRRGHLVDEALSLQISDPAERGERYLKSFIAMADKGLYSYDIASHLQAGIEYFRVAVPRDPLHFSKLPQEIKILVEQTVLAGVSFQASTRISYTATIAA